jgi:hypothetical protein
MVHYRKTELKSSAQYINKAKPAHEVNHCIIQMMLNILAGLFSNGHILYM